VFDCECAGVDIRSALHYENLTYVQVHKAYREILDILSGMLKHL
jgi:hypothetical protein